MYLTDENGVSLCFNEFGDLCGIMDNYENYIAVIRGDISKTGGKVTAITSVRYGDHFATFDYDSGGNLTQITNHNGDKVSFEYRNNTIKSVTYPHGNSVDFEYNDYNKVDTVNSEYLYAETRLTYAGGKLIRIDRVSKCDAITDSGVVKLLNERFVGKVNIRYEDNKVTIDGGEQTHVYYLGYYGELVAQYARDRDGRNTEPLSYAYMSKDKRWGYAVSENNAYDPIYERTEILDKSDKPIAVITPDRLPKGVTELVYSAEGNIIGGDTFTLNSGMYFKTPFGTHGENVSSTYGIKAVVNTENGATEYYASFDYRNPKAQLIALPISIYGLQIKSIELYVCFHQYRTSAIFDKIRLAPAKWEAYAMNDNGTVREKKESKVCLSENVCEYVTTEYKYTDEDKLAEECATITHVGKDFTKIKHAVKKYYYCDHGNVVKTESYIEGEEKNKGVEITERVCDDKGCVIKEISYNSLDSSTKFYKEREAQDNGVTTAEPDATGENKTSFEYVDGTHTVQTQTLPNGSKLTYAYDAHGNKTSVTQSTADGESNGTEIRYTHGYPTRLTSGNNTVYYEYDKKRRVTKTTVNGRETTYEYSGGKYDDTEDVITGMRTIGDTKFRSVTANKVTSKSDGTTTDTYTDKHGNTVMTKANGTVLTVTGYDKTGRITGSGDNTTHSVKKYTYGTDGLKTLDRVEITAGENVESLTENRFYNDYGKLSGRVIGGAVEQSYAYFYKNNAARELEKISLPNNLMFYPQTDVNGRNTGKELKNPDNNNIYGEYIYYRKVGDHGTNMPSSVYFGKTKNNRYSITDNIKYKYDEMGNISEIRENGLLVTKYTYDKIGRLVREDNRKFGKTTLWSYDNCGNILSKRETQYTLKPTDEIEEYTDEKLYAYNGDKLLSFGNEILYYTDIEGKEHVNPLVYRGHDLTWNYGRHLKTFGENTFTYDGYGRRIRKNDTVYTYDANNRLIKQSDGTNVLEFVYDESGLSGVTYNGIDYIFSKDIQGNIVGILDNTGKEVVQYSYDAWGNVKTIVIYETHAIIAELNPFRYRSYYYDTETHLYYLNTRYYDPEVGRFISQDDVSYLDPEHINGLNLFAYCGNNPVMRTDGNGCDWKDILGWIFTVVAVVVATVGGIALSVLSFGAATPLIGFSYTVVAGALLGLAGGITNSIVTQAQINGLGKIDLGQAWVSGIIGGTIGAVSSALSFGFGLIGQEMGQLFGYLLSQTNISGMIVSKVFSTTLLTSIFKVGGRVIGGLIGAFVGGYIGNDIFYSSYTEDSVKDTFGSTFLGWVLEFGRWLFAN